MSKISNSIPFETNTNFSPDSSDIPQYKIVIVGDGGVGKTAFKLQLGGYGFERKYVATLGVETIPININYIKNTNEKCEVRFNIWDTAGQEKFGGLRDGYYIKADLFLIFFDLTSSITLKNVDRWISDITFSHPEYKDKLIIIGNKSDLSGRILSKKEIIELLPPNIPYVEISVKLNQGMNEAVGNMLQKLKLLS